MKSVRAQAPALDGEWSKDSKTHVATMEDGDFRHSERSVTLSEADTLTIEHEAADGTKTTLKDGLRCRRARSSTPR